LRPGREFELWPRQVGALESLLANWSRCVSAERLLARVWRGVADPFAHTGKLAVSRCRAVLGDPPVVETVAWNGSRV
jgi:DNA-binding response OmpR family regulator